MQMNLSDIVLYIKGIDIKNINDNYGQILTFLSIFSGIMIAITGWVFQSFLYKKRATFDLLLKLEESQYHQEIRSEFRRVRTGKGFHNLVELMQNDLANDEINDALFVRIQKIDAYLNFIELISELIHRRQIVFEIFYSQWGGRFIVDVRAAAPYIRYVRDRENRDHIWIWVEYIATRFEERRDRKNIFKKLINIIFSGR